MKKRFIAVALMLCMVFILTACGESKTTDPIEAQELSCEIIANLDSYTLYPDYMDELERESKFLDDQEYTKEYMEYVRTEWNKDCVIAYKVENSTLYLGLMLDKEGVMNVDYWREADPAHWIGLQEGLKQASLEMAKSVNNKIDVELVIFDWYGWYKWTCEDGKSESDILTEEALSNSDLVIYICKSGETVYGR